jgi:hypothetical protein
MKEELEQIRRSIEATVMMLWTSPEDLPEEIQEMIDDTIEEIKDLIANS